MLPILAVLVVLPQLSDAAFCHPTRVGTRWTYTSPAGDRTYTITKAETKDGTRIVSLGLVASDGATHPYGCLEVSGRGIFQIEQSVVVFEVGRGGSETRVKGCEPALWLLKLPAKPGDEWECETEIGKMSFRVGEPEKLKVPAGEFRATPVQLSVRLPDGATSLVYRYWYAPGVGLVKRTYHEGGKECEVVLKSFSRGQG